MHSRSAKIRRTCKQPALRRPSTRSVGVPDQDRAQIQLACRITQDQDSAFGSAAIRVTTGRSAVVTRRSESTMARILAGLREVWTTDAVFRDSSKRGLESPCTHLSRITPGALGKVCTSVSCTIRGRCGNAVPGRSLLPTAVCSFD